MAETVPVTLKNELNNHSKKNPRQTDTQTDTQKNRRKDTMKNRKKAGRGGVGGGGGRKPKEKKKKKLHSPPSFWTVSDIEYLFFKKVFKEFFFPISFCLLLILPQAPFLPSGQFTRSLPSKLTLYL